jgi:hypothetical protein
MKKIYRVWRLIDGRVTLYASKNTRHRAAEALLSAWGWFGKDQAVVSTSSDPAYVYKKYFGGRK